MEHRLLLSPVAKFMNVRLARRREGVVSVRAECHSKWLMFLIMPRKTLSKLTMKEMDDEDHSARSRCPFGNFKNSFCPIR